MSIEGSFCDFRGSFFIWEGGGGLNGPEPMCISYIY